MNQQHLKDYLNLIQHLLDCPDGEEWILLQQHEDLVNPELVQVMEQVAAQLTADGYVDAGKYLHNWAAQLHHILIKEVKPLPKSDDRAQTYLALIQTLLEAPRSKVAEVLAAHEELIGPGLVAMMKQVALQLDTQGEQKKAFFLRELAVELNRAWLQAHAFQPNLEHKKDPVGATKAPRTQAVQQSQKPAPVTEKQPINSVSVATTGTEPAPSSARVSSQKLEQQLAGIAEALDRLNHTLATRLPLSNPVWHLDVLERAQTSHWMLTTSEVEQLIGVKPTCAAGQDRFHRGCWVFHKTGKIGTQSAWCVTKQPEAPISD